MIKLTFTERMLFNILMCVELDVVSEENRKDQIKQYSDNFYKIHQINPVEFLNNNKIEILSILIETLHYTPLGNIFDEELKRLKRIDKLNDLKNNI